MHCLFLLEKRPTSLSTERYVVMPSGQIVPTRKQGNNEPHVLIASGPPEYLATCSLVLSAVGISHTHDPRQGGLGVFAEDADSARYHLDRYFDENRGWPEPAPQVPQSGHTGNPPTLLLIGSLALFFLVTGAWQDDNVWFRNGAIQSEAILEEGEWWRLITALTLHADQVHLLGNCIIGGFIVHLLSKTIGYGLASFLLVVCGALGNLLNIVLRDELHHSVGFSTSIFAAIGLFSGLQLLAGPTMRLKNLILPFGAGASLLAMLGSSGERTDLGAHLFGFVSGIGFGALIGHSSVLRLTGRPGYQIALFMLTICIILSSWLYALH